jgi:N-acetylglucosamine kinase-like BadF-type ATPase
MPNYLGIDCGGTACRALVLNEAGETVFLGHGGAANVASTPDPTIRRSLRRALNEHPPIDAVCACFAGLVSKELREYASELLEWLLPGVPARLEPDYAAALTASPEGTHCVLIAGTGSCICSRVNGEFVRTGGGGYLLGDECSGYQFGRAALREFIRRPDSISEDMRTLLTKKFDSTDPGTVLTMIYNTEVPATLIASFAAPFFGDAEKGKTYALETIYEQTKLLAELVSQHLQTHHPGVKEPGISLAGRVWKHKISRHAFAESMGGLGYKVNLLRSQVPPVRGAALLAMEMSS